MIDTFHSIPILSSLKNKEKIKILFVCLGNICRSPAAEEIMRQEVIANDAQQRWEIDSAGTGGYHVGDLPDRRMRVHAVRRGYDLTHICRQVRPSDFNRFDLIIGMDDANVRNLKALAPMVEDMEKVIPMSTFLDPGMGYDHIPDPYYEGAEGFERVLDLLQNGCHRLFTALS